MDSLVLAISLTIASRDAASRGIALSNLASRDAASRGIALGNLAFDDFAPCDAALGYLASRVPLDMLLFD